MGQRTTGGRMRSSLLVIILLSLSISPFPAFGELVLKASMAARADGTAGLKGDVLDDRKNRENQEYQEYQGRLDSVRVKEDIEEAGFLVVEDQVFPVELKGQGEVSFIPAYDSQYRRLALFFADGDGQVVFKTDRLETNIQRRGSLRQPNEWLAAVSFQDLDGDGLSDIVLITACSYLDDEERGEGEASLSATGIYKVGDVLFQKDGAFYRDYRLSGQLNRFGMNKSVKFITSFIRDGYSTEFLYTAATQKELLDHGFEIAMDQYYPRQFEKLGRLFVAPGTYRMAEYTVFMIYLINEEGYIVWSFQPMGDYESLYGLKGVSCLDIDGDGLKDIIVLAGYSYEGSGGQSVVESAYSVYYQRTAGFYEDTEMKQAIKCSGTETMSELVERARAYWGWRAEG